jgi:hypothetical protein
MKLSNIFIIMYFALTISGCASSGPVEKRESASLLHIEGTVKIISGNEVTTDLKIPELKKTPGSPASDIAQQVVQKTILIEGIKTEVDGTTATIKTIRGNTTVINFEKPVPYQVGAVIKLMVPKKTIAVVDFEVIKGHEKETGPEPL